MYVKCNAVWKPGICGQFFLKIWLFHKVLAMIFPCHTGSAEIFTAVPLVETIRG